MLDEGYEPAAVSRFPLLTPDAPSDGDVTAMIDRYNGLVHDDPASAYSTAVLLPDGRPGHTIGKDLTSPTRANQMPRGRTDTQGHILPYRADAKVSDHLTQRMGRAESDATNRAIAQRTCTTSVLDQLSGGNRTCLRRVGSCRSPPATIGIPHGPEIAHGAPNGHQSL